MAGGQTRARFIGTGAAALGGAVVASAWRTDRAGASTAAADIAAAKCVTDAGTVTDGAFDARFYGDQFSFEFDGAVGGKLDDVSGGLRYADVVTEKLGADNIAKKHIANIKWSDMSVSHGTGMSKGFYNWIKASFDGKSQRKTGSVVSYDKSGLVTGSGQFMDALITEVGFPGLDAGAKDAAKMTIKFQPETTKYVARTGKAPALGGATPQISSGSINLSVDGLPTARVSKIDSFTWKQAAVASVNGDGSVFQFAPGPITIPDLSFYFPDTIEQEWIDYFQDFVVNGNSGDDKERSGKLTLQDKKSRPLLTVAFSHLGIFKLTPEKVEAGSESIRRIKVDMYCENMTFDYTALATFG